MKIVIDLRLINASGIGTYLKNVIPGILGCFKQVIVLGNSNELKKFEWSKKVEIIEFNAKIYSLEEQLLYPFIIPKCDFFWSPHFNVPLLGTRAKKKIVTIHDVNHLVGVSPISRIKKVYAFLLLKKAVNNSSIIFTVSQFSKSEIIKHTKVNPKKIKVVYCGVDASFYQKKTIEDGFKDFEDYILYVGNIKPHKNLIVLLKAYNSLSEEFKLKYKILIVGQKEGFITKDKQIDEFIITNKLEKHIVFTGYVDDLNLPKYYQQAALFVFPSLYEGFGLPVLEALAANTLVVSSNAASLKEVGGESVVYFDPNNPTELAEKMVNCLNSEDFKIRMSKFRDVQLKKYTWLNSISNHKFGFENIK
ncbi:glycosyltransferase family 1 protein [Flavobacterium sp. NG2]|uniref:glycosyltransferase family 4 protein n=1 Tax=Flavobacterium sp. NG2 TaxID=3097547 RepID=UPI002A803D33|nr:glycosyltransferase family 1 protein [Flavobacterium sp. NG2]WPR72269.1 glycosyltransferase family 1 protein [Flavobacterium sp. NG2]